MPLEMKKYELFRPFYFYFLSMRMVERIACEISVKENNIKKAYCIAQYANRNR